MGVVLFYSTQIAYELKFCVLKECVAVQKEKDKGQFMYGYICTAVVWCSDS